MRPLRVLALLLIFTSVLAAASPASAQTAPCAPGTPPAVEFRGLPSRIAFGVDHVFETDFGDLDWDVIGRVTYAMTDSATAEPFFTTTGTELEELFVRLDLGDAPAIVSADFIQRNDQEVYDEATGEYVAVSTTCSNRITRDVAGYRHFYLPNCDKLRYQPERVIVACGDGNFQLRRIHWTTWNGRRATGHATAMLNDCIPYCARGRFHSYRAKVKVYRPRICHRGYGAAGYHYTRLKIRYLRPLSRKYFPWAGRRDRRGYTHESTCFPFDR